MTAQAGAAGPTVRCYLALSGLRPEGVAAGDAKTSGPRMSRRGRRGWCGWLDWFEVTRPPRFEGKLTAGVLAAAAGTTTDVRLRRD